MNTVLFLQLLCAVVAICNAFQTSGTSRMRANALTSVQRMSSPLKMSFETKYFKKDAVDMAGTTEYVVKGGTHVSNY